MEHRFSLMTLLPVTDRRGDRLFLTELVAEGALMAEFENWSVWVLFTLEFSMLSVWDPDCLAFPVWMTACLV